jgi:hypothetical protein
MRGWLVALLGGAYLFAACGGDDDGPVGSTFHVLRVTPERGAAEVDLASPVVIAFSDPVDAASVSEASVALEGVEADLAVDGSTVTLTPRQPFPYETLEALAVTRDVTSTDGSPLAAAFSSEFTTRWRVWSAPRVIGSASGLETTMVVPAVAGRAGGGAVAVWQQSETGQYPFSLAGARYDLSTDEWAQDPAIASGGPSYSLDPRVAADDSGRVLLLWRDEGHVEQAWLEPDADAWDHRDPVHVAPSIVSPPVLAMSRGGRAAVAWTESPNGRMVSRFDGTWSAPDALGVGELEEAALTIDDDGTATLVWTEGPSIVVRRYTGSWSDAEPLWTDAEGRTADRARVAALPGGGAVVVWGVVVEGVGAEAHARFLAGGTWGEDVLVGTAETPAATLPEVAVSGDGDVLVVWDDWNGGLIARWWRDGAWERESRLAGLYIVSPDHAVAIDQDGNATTAYADIRASYYRRDQAAWVNGELVANGTTEPIAVTFAGDDPVAVWEQYHYDEASGRGISDGLQASFFR